MYKRLLLAVTALSASVALSASSAPAAAAPTARTYRNCAALNQDYPTGVGVPGAVDRVSGGGRGVTNFTRDKAVYQANKNRLDRDRDGIACEKRGTPRGSSGGGSTRPAPSSGVTLALATSRPRRGTPVAAGGVVKGLPADTPVTLQATQGRTWRTIGTSRVRASGRYSAEVTLAPAGRTAVRAVASGSGRTLTSPTVIVVVRAGS